jgi:pimeloyl-ACP methyl ester carboxylesterase
LSQSHTPLVPLKLGESSKAAYALSGATIAIVFLHGYGGTAVGTWKQFDSLLFDFPPAENADLFFIGYPSTTRATEASAYSFHQVLDELFTKAAGSRRPSSIRGNRTEPYRKIVVVAHSMGSVVVRRALLLADVHQRMWTQNVAMVLFAPAHFGARFHNYADSAVAGIFKLIWQFGQYRSPAINELRIDSPYLRQLRDDVTEALQKSPAPHHLIAKRVIHGLDDIIVDQPGHNFCDDPPCTFIPGTHKSLCKPGGIDNLAVQELRIFLERWA